MEIPVRLGIMDTMLTFQSKYQFKKYSQYFEDGILQEIIKRINPIQTCAEFGAANGHFCSNTFYLIEQGWAGVLIEGNKNYMEDLLKNTEGKEVFVINAFVNKKSINLLPSPLGVLSIDVDNDDYHLWEAYKGHPEIVIIEINSSIEPPREEVPGKAGASYYSMVKLAIKKGYFLLAHTGNLIFVRNDHRKLFPEITGDGLNNWREYFDKSFL